MNECCVCLRSGANETREGGRRAIPFANSSPCLCVDTQAGEWCVCVCATGVVCVGGREGERRASATTWESSRSRRSSRHACSVPAPDAAPMLLHVLLLLLLEGACAPPPCAHTRRQAAATQHCTPPSPSPPCAATMGSLMAGQEFQHILRLLNTNGGSLPTPPLPAHPHRALRRTPRTPPTSPARPRNTARTTQSTASTR